MKTPEEQHLLRRLEKETCTIRRQKLLKDLWKIAQSRSGENQIEENPTPRTTETREETTAGRERAPSSSIAV